MASGIRSRYLDLQLGTCRVRLCCPQEPCGGRQWQPGNAIRRRECDRLGQAVSLQHLERRRYPWNDR